MCPSNADKLANCVDPDQTAVWSDWIAVWSRFYTVYADLSVRKLWIIRANKKNIVFSVTWPFLNFLVKPRIFLQVFERKENAFWELNSLCFCLKKKRKNKAVPTLPTIFRPITLYTVTHFFIWPFWFLHLHVLHYHLWSHFWRIRYMWTPPDGHEGDLVFISGRLRSASGRLFNSFFNASFQALFNKSRKEL